MTTKKEIFNAIMKETKGEINPITAKKMAKLAAKQFEKGKRVVQYYFGENMDYTYKEPQYSGIGRFKGMKYFTSKVKPYMVRIYNNGEVIFYYYSDLKKHDEIPFVVNLNHLGCGVWCYPFIWIND